MLIHQVKSVGSIKKIRLRIFETRILGKCLLIRIYDKRYMGRIMKGTELVLKALRDKGVKYIFGYTGGAIMPIFDEMEKQKCFTFIMSRHEQGAAFMAQGISRASVGTAHPRTGVCMATSGPGAMNLVTGVADASMDSVPLLAITGQVATGVIASDAFQESDVVGVMMPLTKQSYMPLSVDEIEETIHEAINADAGEVRRPDCRDIADDRRFSRGCGERQGHRGGPFGVYGPGEIKPSHRGRSPGGKRTEPQRRRSKGNP